MATRQQQAVTTFNLDPAHSQVEFSAKHMMLTTVRGRFGEVSGVIRVDEENPDASSVEVTINAASIDTRVEDRDAHLKSADFLDVENYPELTFRSKRIEGAHAEPGDTFQIIGDLTIRDQTREVTVEAQFEGTGQDPWGGRRAGFSGSTKIDRREFGLTWNQALETGGILVGNELKIELSVQAVEQAD